MTIALAILAWYAAGAACIALWYEFGWRRGSYPLDIRVGDVAVGVAFSIFGPFLLLLPVTAIGGWLARKIGKRINLDTRRIVFPAHERLK